MRFYLGKLKSNIMIFWNSTRTVSLSLPRSSHAFIAHTLSYMAQSLSKVNCNYEKHRSDDLDASGAKRFSEVFEWICKQNLPQIEDESPPPGFYEVLESPKLHYAQQDALTDLVEQQLHEFRSQTILHVVQMTAEMHSLPEPQSELQSEPQSEPQSQPQSQSEPQSQPQSEPQSEPENQMQTQQTQTDVQKTGCSQNPATAAQQRLRWRQGQPSVWSLVKKLLLVMSLLHGGYMLSSYASRSAIMQRMLHAVQLAATPPPPPTRPLPVFVWSQLCRIARKLLHI